jgi:hypothetical protein
VVKGVRNLACERLRMGKPGVLLIIGSFHLYRVYLPTCLCSKVNRMQFFFFFFFLRQPSPSQNI